MRRLAHVKQGTSGMGRRTCAGKTALASKTSTKTLESQPKFATAVKEPVGMQIKNAVLWGARRSSTPMGLKGASASALRTSSGSTKPA